MTTHSTHQYSPYRSLYGWDSRTIHVDNDYELSSPATEEWLDRITTVHNQIHHTLKQIHIKRSAVQIEKAGKFAVNDWVLVDQRNRKVKAENNRSLTNKWIGPYKVIVTIGTHPYRLEVPEGTRWHNIIHTTLLKPLQIRDDTQDMDEDEHNEIYEVETILNSRKYIGVVKYWIRWKGYEELEDT